MHTKSALSVSVLTVALFLAAALPAAAQPTAVDTAQSTTTTQQLQKPLATPGSDASQAPLLYEGEMDDVGPQYVLQPEPKPKYFSVSSDWQLYHTDNAVLAPANKAGTDVNVFSISADMHTQEKQWWSKYTAQFSGGIHYQYYWYGVFSDRNAIASGAPIKNSDFQTITPYAQFSLKRDEYSGVAGIRYADFSNNNATTSGTFYQEWVPYWTLSRQMNLAAHEIFQVQYDGDYRATNTPSGGLQPVGWNDRVDNALSLVYSYIVNDHFLLQPSLRVMSSIYTADGRHRSDVYTTLSFVAAYYFNENASVRAFTSWEERDSSEAGNNYQDWNLGVGGSLQFQF